MSLLNALVPPVTATNIATRHMLHAEN